MKLTVEAARVAADRDLEDARRLLSAATLAARAAEAHLGTVRKDPSLGRQAVEQAQWAAERARKEEKRAEDVKACAVQARRQVLDGSREKKPAGDPRWSVVAHRQALVLELQRVETALALMRVRLSRARRAARAAEAALGQARKLPGQEGYDTHMAAWDAARRAREVEQAAEQAKRAAVMVRRRLLSKLQ